MGNFKAWRRALAFAALFALSAGMLFAQAETGNVFGVVTDEQGAKLPGVTVQLTGYGAPRVQVTNAEGLFRFLSLDPGNYSLTATLEGFSSLEYPAVNVRLGRNTNLELQLSSAVEEVITVTSESPLLDERRAQQGTNVTQVELEKIPTARDPWSILSQTPGVMVDRINVGGSQSGQQAVFVANGTTDDENNFSVDGVQITDMAAIGSSATYYDFDQFTEVQITTGGNDVDTVSSGVQVNLVTKRGTNELRGTARVFFTDARGWGPFQEAGNDPKADDYGLFPAAQTPLSGSKINEIHDYGAEAGGPVVQDKLWFWGSFGRNDIRQFATGGTADDTVLENAAFKLNAQFSQNNSATGSWNNGDKKKFGRDASPQRPTATTRDQRGPTAIIKVEDTHVFNANFFLSGGWSFVDGGFSLAAKGNSCLVTLGDNCDGTPEAVWDDNAVWQNTFTSGSSSRPSEAWNLDGSYFFNTASTNHELKFGARLRRAESQSNFGAPGPNNTRYSDGEVWGTPGIFDAPDLGVIGAWRSGPAPILTDYRSIWAQDTLTTGRLTVNVGFRYDDQDGKNSAASLLANPLFPDLMPALDFPGNDGDGANYQDIQPRVGVTYALGEERKTLLRGSFSRFVQQLDIGTIANVNPVATAIAYLEFVDIDNDNFWDGPVAEPDIEFFYPYGFDPTDPTSTTSPNQNDPGLDAETTDEIIIGIEHAFLPELVVGLNYTNRTTRDLEQDYRFIRNLDTGEVRIAQASDYVADSRYPNGVSGTNPYDGTAYTLFPQTINDDWEITGGRLRTNSDNEIQYDGFSFSVVKRLANRWMVRAYASFGEGEYNLGSDFLRDEDPNDWATTTATSARHDGEDTDGDVTAIQSGGSGSFSNVFISSGWTFNVNGMYQVAPDKPWGFNIAANINGREGYPIPLADAVGGSDGVSRTLAVTPQNDTFRHDDPITVDMRVEKEWRTTNNSTLTFSIDAFNLLDDQFVLARQRRTDSRAGYVEEILSPRIFRLGLRLGWR